MFATRLKWKLDPDCVRGTPNTHGVYGLWDDDELVYLGATERSLPLQAALEEVLALQQRGAIHATHFTWEITITPRSWAGELLRLHFSQHGALPRYNCAGGPIHNAPQADTYST